MDNDYSRFIQRSIFFLTGLEGFHGFSEELQRTKLEMNMTSIAQIFASSYIDKSGNYVNVIPPHKPSVTSTNKIEPTSQKPVINLYMTH